MKKVSFHEQIARNKRNSIFLFIFVFAVIIALAYVFGMIYDPALMIFFVGFALLFTVLHSWNSYVNGDKIVLKMVNAVPAEKSKYPHLINSVEGLSLAAGIPAPKVYVMESGEMNAFATGRDPEHASIAVTTSLIKNLNRTELEGVIAHEMSHIANYDIRFGMLVAVLVGLAAMLSYVFLRSLRYGGSRDRGKGSGYIIIVGLVLAIVAPIIVRLVQLAASRQREYLADSTGAKLTRYPEGLASALEKIGKVNQGKMEVSEAVSHLFTVDPTKSFMDKVTSTHPPIKERIRRLRMM